RHTRFSRDWSSDVCSSDLAGTADEPTADGPPQPRPDEAVHEHLHPGGDHDLVQMVEPVAGGDGPDRERGAQGDECDHRVVPQRPDRKSTRLNSSHVKISYA